MRTSFHFIRLVGVIGCLLLVIPGCVPAKRDGAQQLPGTAAAHAPQKKSGGIPGTLLAGCRRTVFLGDSITYSGQYVDYVEYELRSISPESEFEFLNLGLPSETVSGLSEPGHAGGAFPRPDLRERLERVISMTRPDCVIACYGMNDGIYYPFNAEKFEKFKEGIRHLRDVATKAGAKVILVTPPVFDPVPIRGQTLPAGLAEYRKPYEGYNEVLDRYSEWLVEQRLKGWVVIDSHSPMNSHLKTMRLSNPAYALASDGVHLNESGHWLIAQAVLGGLRVGKVHFSAAPPVPDEKLKLIRARNLLLRDAWLTAVGHKRPGITPGLPLAEAEDKARDLMAAIQK